MSEVKDEIQPKCCPVCFSQTNYAYRINEKDYVKEFYRCACGVVFKENYEASHFDEYDEKYLQGHALADYKQFTHAARCYSNVIEELTYGRQMLEVGGLSGQVMDFFQKRGWIGNLIDVNPAIKAGGNVHLGDIANYDFSIEVPKDLVEAIGEEKIERKFDLIWMSHVIEHVEHPLQVLKKLHDMLSPSGVLYLAAPEPEFIMKQGVAGWAHWKPKEHNIFMPLTVMVRELERIGFEVILKKRNFSSRFMQWYDWHIIAQKKYF